MWYWVLLLSLIIPSLSFAQPLDDVHLSGTVSGYSSSDTTLLSVTTVVIENLANSHHDTVITDISGHWSWTGIAGISGEHNSSLPSDLALAPSYPNPFTETTTIRIQNNVQQRVRLDVYNILGQRVAELVNDNLRPGAFDLTWNGMGRNGSPLAQGLYFLCLTGGGHAVTQKLVVLGSGSGTSDISLRMSNPGNGGAFEPSRGSNSRRSTLDDFSLRLQFLHAGYDSVIMSLTLPDGRDSSMVTYLRHHTVPLTNMVYIPAGGFSMGYQTNPSAIPVHAVNLQPFYMDAYEVTNAQYRQFCDETGQAYPPDATTGFYPPPYFANPVYANYPVVSVTWSDARAYASWVGKRLPTEAEWERAAKGDADNRDWPWGDTWVAGYANTSELGDGYSYTSPVGSYPNGISPAGCFDMAGNVDEWCEDDWHDNYNGAPYNGSAWINTPRSTIQVIRGGSWYDVRGYTYCTFRRHYTVPNTRSITCGFRCAMTATNQPPEIPSWPTPAQNTVIQGNETYLMWNGGDTDGDSVTYDIFFGTTSAPPLEYSGQTDTSYYVGPLSDSTNYFWQIIAHDNHGNSTAGPVWSFHTAGQTENMAYIPAGSYNMGADYDLESQPIHAVNVPAFFIDRYEVTNAQYKVFCDITNRIYPQDDDGYFYPSPYFTNPAFANYPVVNVTWNDARAYATWAGKRLPTEAEWERAAKGNAGQRQWPWGNTWVTGNANIQDTFDGFEFTSPVGRFPGGVSPVGCYDMCGNVEEWCEDDWHSDYTGAPTDGSAWIDTPRNNGRIVRSGSWEDQMFWSRCTYRTALSPTLGLRRAGFRCAQTP